MTQLAELRVQLESLGARRRRARVVDVALFGGGALVVALLAYYLLDRRLALHVGSRLFLDAVLVGGAVWFAWKKFGPAWGNRDDAIDTALRFERRRGIDADLVAALQFDEFAARGDFESQYGSSRLAGAVVDQVAAARREWNFSEEPVDAAPRRRRLGFVALMLLGIVATIAYPRHAAVFVQRMLLGSAHYPSNTQIAMLTVNGRPVLPASASGKDAAAPAIVVPLGRPLNFELQTSGALSETVRIELTGEKGAVALLELAAVVGESHRFQGVLPALVESVQGRATAGDAYTEPFELAASALPTVTVTLEVSPPAYAADSPLDVPPPGRLHAAVLEGSDVAIHVASTGKPLAEVVLTHGDVEYRFERDGDDRRWRLDPPGTEFANIARPIEFTIDAVDADGFHLSEPLRGSLAMRADQPPTVAADVVTKYVLPTGRPSILYQAADDLGVQSLTIERQIVRIDGTSQSDSVPLPLPVDQPRTAPTGKFPLELSGLQLHKGDKVTVTLVARDRGGDLGRAPARSEPFTLEVTDEQGLYAAMAETDQRSALKMDEIIQKQLMMTGRTGGITTPPPPKPTPTPTAGPTATGEKP
jgi:hypothetical protein